MLPPLPYASFTAFIHLFLYQSLSILQHPLPLFHLWCFYPCISTSTQFWWLPGFCDLSTLAVMVPFMSWPYMPCIDNCISASIILPMIWTSSPCFDATLSSLLFQPFLIWYCSCQDATFNALFLSLLTCYYLSLLLSLMICLNPDLALIFDPLCYTVTL